MGRKLGFLRGISSVLVSHLQAISTSMDKSKFDLAEAQDIARRLVGIQFSDINPRDLEAEEHARQHLESEGGDVVNAGNRSNYERMEELERKLPANPSAEALVTLSGRPTVQDLEKRLETLCHGLGLVLDWN